MKFMEIINKLQAGLTELRREVQREEASRAERPKCSTCGKPAVGGQGTALQATIHFCEDHRPTAGECRCEKDPFCPVHTIMWRDTPDLPGTADPHWCFVCGKPADMGLGNALGPQRGYCRKHMPQRATGTVGDRYFKLPDGRTQCRECGWIVLVGCNCVDRADPGRKQKRHTPNPLFGTSVPKDIIDKIIKHPDLPLHVKVAKANGLKPYFGDGEWYVAIQLGSAPYESENYEVKKVPNYPNDLVAAIAALEEYTAILPSNVYMRYSIQHSDGGFNRRERVIGIRGARHRFAIDLPLSQAICEAIVAHAEGK